MTGEIRKPLAALTLAALTGVGLVGVAQPANAGVSSAKGPRPVMQLPFPCEQKLRLNTWSHAPALDMVREPQKLTMRSKLIAPAAGTVIMSKEHPNAGNVIKINHGGGWYTVYLHLDSRSVAVGARLTRGSVLGFVGSTGTKSAHLHFETWYDSNGDGKVGWGRPGRERVPSVFNGVQYSRPEYRNVVSRNCGYGEIGPR
ncbi:M23 family metallopeptidase [Nonomuraea sp. NPDC046802]|uniref:M23 family metallopeptidase n=1 Tax=Nonomuraea sp. NPDC046802 TaxID=3154919 RepID=UPI0033D6CDC5